MVVSIETQLKEMFTIQEYLECQLEVVLEEIKTLTKKCPHKNLKQSNWTDEMGIEVEMYICNTCGTLLYGEDKEEL